MIGTSLSEITLGHFMQEHQAWDAFDQAVALDGGLWKSYAEVRGYHFAPMVGQDHEGKQIDRILVPTAKMIELGWKYGSIGIEVKKSGMALAPIFSQCLDYRRSVFTLTHNFRIHLDTIFVFEADKQQGGMGHLCCANRIGTCHRDKRTGRLKFYLGELCVFRFEADGKPKFGLNVNSVGRKCGHRSGKDTGRLGLEAQQ